MDEVIGTHTASSGWERSTAMSARQSPPSASAMTRSAMIFPGSCTARAARHRASPAVRASPRPVTRAASASSNAPAWETRPWPSADTVILGRRAVLFTWKVPSVWCGQDPRQIPSSQAKALFICKRSRSADRRRKPEARPSLITSREAAGRSSAASQARPGPLQHPPGRLWPWSASTAWIRLRTSVRSRTSWIRCRSSARSCRTCGGAIHASGSRSARSSWAKIAASTLSFFSLAEAIALHRSGCTKCGLKP